MRWGVIPHCGVGIALPLPVTLVGLLKGRSGCRAASERYWKSPTQGLPCLKGVRTSCTVYM